MRLGSIKSRYGRRDAEFAQRPALIGFGLAIPVVFAAALWGWTAFQSRSFSDAVDEKTGCFVNKETPHAKLAMIDMTDPLADNAVRVRQALKEAAAQLPRYGRLIVLPVADDLARPLTPVFNKCWPGMQVPGELGVGADYLANERDAFFSALEEAMNFRWPEARKSPIPQQIVRAASDPMLGWTGTARSLLLITDGLETSFYSTDPSLAGDERNQLREVDVTFFEIGNSRDISRQTPNMRKLWTKWIETDQGGKLTMVAPGYPSSR